MSDLSSLRIEGLRAQEFIDAVAVPAAVHAGGHFIAANDALCRLSRRTLAELQALPYAQLVAADDSGALERVSVTCLDGSDTPPVVSARILTPDGGERPAEIHARPISLAGSVAVMLTCVDQTDILFTQNSLFSLHAMMSQIIDGAPIASYVIDQDHNVTQWNSACERLTGQARYEMLGSTEVWRVFYDSQRPMLAERVVDGDTEMAPQSGVDGWQRASTVIPGGLEAEAFFPRFGKNGTWLYFTAAPLRDAQGKIIGAIETLQDVTERRLAEAELLRHRNELEQLVQKRSAELAATALEMERFVVCSPLGVAYSSDGVIQRVNATMAAMFGYTEAEMTGVPADRCCLSTKDYAELGRHAQDVLSRGEPLHHEMWMRHADGHPIWVQIDAHVADSENTDRGTWWMMQDRTEIRAATEQVQARFEELRLTNSKLEDAQNQLLQQDKMASIGQLAAGVAHEINNPVGFVNSNLNTLRQYIDGLLALSSAYEAALAAPGDAAAAGALEKKRAEVEIDYLREDLPQLLDECADGLSRVKKIVQDLKDFSRVDQAEWQEADLNAGFESTLNVVRHEVKYKAEIVKLLTPLPPVMCLAAQINQVFLNLIVNAVHAIAERGTITLSSGVQEGWAWLQVDDTGCGMSEDVRRRIFEPFYTTKEVGKGTGLGLSLSFSIAQKHGGAIQVKSTPGLGSSFRVWLPVGGPQSVPAGAAPPVWTETPEP